MHFEGRRANWMPTVAAAAAWLVSVDVAEAQYDPLTDVPNLLFFVHSDDATNHRGSPMSGTDDHVMNYSGATPNIAIVDPDGLDAGLQCDPIDQIYGPFPFPYQRAVAGETLSIASYMVRVRSNTKTDIFFDNPFGISYPFTQQCSFSGVGTSPHADWSLSGSTGAVTDRSLSGLQFLATGNESTYPAMDLIDVPGHIVWDASNAAGRKLNARLQYSGSAASALNHTTTPSYTSSFTLFFFVRIDSFGGDGQRFIEFHNSANTGSNFLWFGSAGTSAAAGMKLIRYGASNVTYAPPASPAWVRDNDFHLYAVTWDATTNRAEFFQDGVSKGLSPSSLPSPTITGLDRITIVGPGRGNLALSGTAYVGGVGATTGKLTATEQADLYTWFIDSFDL